MFLGNVHTDENIVEGGVLSDDSALVLLYCPRFYQSRRDVVGRIARGSREREGAIPVLCKWGFIGYKVL